MNGAKRIGEIREIVDITTSYSYYDGSGMLHIYGNNSTGKLLCVNLKLRLSDMGYVAGKIWEVFKKHQAQTESVEKELRS